ncbi:MAG: biotin transporter BioY [Streptomycetaceae bacterium]|nr:MAG: biotin transporter BioY [Streptomycetaceae bacterium]
MSISAISLRSAVLGRTSVATNALLVAGGVVVLALLAQVALPIPGSPVPVTGQTLGVLLIGTSYGATLGLTTFITYLLVGLAGVPVFAGATFGLARLTGATGGYLVGMLIASFIVGALAGRKWDQRISKALATMLLGDVIIFSLGLFWLHASLGKSWTWTIAAGFTPFIIGEVLKIAIAGTSLPLVWRFVQK